MKNICDWNNCKEIANYKAPVEKDNSKKYSRNTLNLFLKNELIN